MRFGFQTLWSDVPRALGSVELWVPRWDLWRDATGPSFRTSETRKAEHKRSKSGANFVARAARDHGTVSASAERLGCRRSSWEGQGCSMQETTEVTSCLKLRDLWMYHVRCSFPKETIKQLKQMMNKVCKGACHVCADIFICVCTCHALLRMHIAVRRRSSSNIFLVMFIRKPPWSAGTWWRWSDHQRNNCKRNTERPLFNLTLLSWLGWLLLIPTKHNSHLQGIVLAVELPPQFSLCSVSSVQCGQQRWDPDLQLPRAEMGLGQHTNSKISRNRPTMTECNNCASTPGCRFESGTQKPQSHHAPLQKDFSSVEPCPPDPTSGDGWWVRAD